MLQGDSVESHKTLGLIRTDMMRSCKQNQRSRSLDVSFTVGPLFPNTCGNFFLKLWPPYNTKSIISCHQVLEYS